MKNDTYVQLPLAAAVLVLVGGLIALAGPIVIHIDPQAITMLCGLAAGLVIAFPLILVVLASARRRDAFQQETPAVVLILQTDGQNRQAKYIVLTPEQTTSLPVHDGQSLAPTRRYKRRES